MLITRAIVSTRCILVQRYGCLQDVFSAGGLSARTTSRNREYCGYMHTILVSKSLPLTTPIQHAGMSYAESSSVSQK